MTRRPTTFLARDTYRRRRLIDALRVLPVLGALLFLVPMLGASTTDRSTAFAGMYLFAAWFLLIVGAALLVRAVGRAPGGVASDPLEPGSVEDED
mgnify:CR=1 FL=1